MNLLLMTNRNKDNRKGGIFMNESKNCPSNVNICLKAADPSEISKIDTYIYIYVRDNGENVHQ